MTQRSVLDTADTYSYRPEKHFLVQSDWRDGMLASHQINGAVAGARTRRHLELRWPSANRATAEVLRDHYTKNAHKAFSLFLPGSATAIDVIYAAPPRIRAATAAQFSISVEIEEALITD